MILVVTHAGDAHAPPVLSALGRLGARVAALDLADLPRAGRLSLAYGAAGRLRELRLDGQPPVRLDEVTAVWWRRPRPFAAAGGLRPGDAAFAVRQAGEAVMGLLASLGAAGVRMVNDPWRDEVASLKTHQLAAAGRAGLSVPPTLVTSDPEAARAFVDACGRDGAIHKALHPAGTDGHPTRRVGPADLSRLDEVTAVWWRRPRPFAAAAGLRPGDAAFATRQAGEAVMGLLASLGEAGVRMVNDPWRDEVASLKTHQLAAAGRAGLDLPPTLVTSDPEAARAFLDACGRDGAIHKALHPAGTDGRPTRRVGPADLSRLAALRLAPVILQAYVPGVDVRVTAVGNELFAAEIDARATASPADFRPVLADCRVAPCALDDRDAAAIRALLRDLGLAYAALDLRRRDDGSLAFLEVNPAGQWYFVEQRTGQPITAALASLLVKGHGLTSGASTGPRRMA